MSKKLMLLAFLMLVPISVGHTANLGTDPALVIYYSYNEFTDVVMDQSGHGINGTVQGDITADPAGMYGGAAKFAQTSYLDLDGPSVPPEDIPTSAITLAAWAKCENTGGHHAIFNARRVRFDVDRPPGIPKWWQFPLAAAVCRWDHHVRHPGRPGHLGRMDALRGHV